MYAAIAAAPPDQPSSQHATSGPLRLSWVRWAPGGPDGPAHGRGVLSPSSGSLSRSDHAARCCASQRQSSALP